MKDSLDHLFNLFVKKHNDSFINKTSESKKSKEAMAINASGVRVCVCLHVFKTLEVQV